MNTKCTIRKPAGFSRSTGLRCIAFALIAAACRSTAGPTSTSEFLHTDELLESVDAGVGGVEAGIPSAELSAIEAYWNQSYYADSDIQNSFETLHGTHVDCIDFYAQHSVKTLLAQGLEVPVPTPPPVSPTTAPLPQGMRLDGTLDQNGSPRQCAAGSIATTRPSIATIEAAGGLSAYQQMLKSRARPEGSQSLVEHDCWLNPEGLPLNYSTSNFPTGSNPWCPTSWNLSPGAGYCGNYDHAVGIQNSGWLPSGAAGYYGLTTTLSIHHPYIQAAHEQAVSQFWMQTGTCDNWYNNNFGAKAAQQCATGSACTSSSCAVQSLESGWISTVTGTSQFFVFFTSDGYYNIGCYAGFGGSGCPGGTDPWIVAPFASVFVNETFAAGTPGGTPSEMTVGAYGYGSNSFWAITVAGNTVGYYPASIYNWPTGESGAGTAGPMVNGPATYLQAGGEVFNVWPGNLHTQTQMVSPYPPSSGYTYTGYQRNIQYLDSSQTYHQASLGFSTAPSYENDDSVPGLCGLDSGAFYETRLASGYYSLSTTEAAGGPSWGEYFYLGSGTLAR